MSAPNDFDVLLPCPRCGEKASHSIGTLRTKPLYNCPYCGTTIRVEVNDATDTVSLAPWRSTG